MLRCSINNTSIMLAALDSLKFLKNPDEYAFILAEDISKRPKQERVQLQLLELTQYMTISRGRKLLKIVRDSLPFQTDESGNVHFSVTLGSPADMLLNAPFLAERHLTFRGAYKSSKAGGQLPEFFSKATVGKREERDKAWLLYRYHSDLAFSLTKKYFERKTVAVYDEVELKGVLAGMLRHAKIYPAFIPLLTEVKNLIRQYAFGDSKAAYRVNGLFLLEEFANEDDLPKLRKLPYDQTNITWREGKTRTHCAPLVAIRALHCIKAVNSAESRLILEEISQNEKVHPKVSKQAKEMLQK